MVPRPTKRTDDDMGQMDETDRRRHLQATPCLDGTPLDSDIKHIERGLPGVVKEREQFIRSLLIVTINFRQLVQTGFHFLPKSLFRSYGKFLYFAHSGKSFQHTRTLFLTFRHTKTESVEEIGQIDHRWLFLFRHSTCSYRGKQGDFSASRFPHKTREDNSPSAAS